MSRELMGTEIFVSHNLSNKINTKRDDIFREYENELFLALRSPKIHKSIKGVQ